MRLLGLVIGAGILVVFALGWLGEQLERALSRAF